MYKLFKPVHKYAQRMHYRRSALRCIYNDPRSGTRCLCTRQTIKKCRLFTCQVFQTFIYDEFMLIVYFALLLVKYDKYWWFRNIREKPHQLSECRSARVFLDSSASPAISHSSLLFYTSLTHACSLLFACHSITPKIVSHIRAIFLVIHVSGWATHACTANAGTRGIFYDACVVCVTNRVHALYPTHTRLSTPAPIFFSRVTYAHVSIYLYD